MRFCCTVFDGLVSEAGNAGFSAVLKQCGSEIGFFVQGRTTNVDQEAKLLSMPRADDPPRPFLTVMQQGIAYCPFCGAKLDVFLDKESAELSKLMLKHKPFVM